MCSSRFPLLQLQELLDQKSRLAVSVRAALVLDHRMEGKKVEDGMKLVFARMPDERCNEKAGESLQLHILLMVDLGCREAEQLLGVSFSLSFLFSMLSRG